MKIKTSLPMLMTMCALPLADLPAQHVPVASTLENVLVYRSGASIERQGKASLSAGHNELRFEALSPDLDPASIQIIPNKAMTILSVGHGTSYLSEQEKPEELIKLEADLEKLKMEIEGLQVEKSVLETEQQFLTKNMEVKGENEALNMDRMEQYLSFFTKKMRAIQTKKGDLDRKMQPLLSRYHNLERQIKEYHQAAKSKRSAYVTAEVVVETAGEVQFELRYLVQNAYWEAAYDVYAQPQEDEIGFVQIAKITNRSSEDWANVSLSLSTGNPNRSSYIPKLQPWWLREQKRYAPQVSSMPAPRAKAENMMMDEAAAGPAVEAEEAWTTVNFAIEGRFDIPADGKQKAIVLDRRNLPVSYSYTTVPKLDPSVYLSAKITDWEEAFLNPGEIKLFLENSFVGKTYLNTNQVSDTLNLSLGADERITVERKKLKSFDKKQFLGSKITSSSVFEISLRNQKSVPVTIVVKDQIPISTHQDITVTAENLSGAKLNKETGMLEWELELKAGEQRKIKFGYEVKYPKDMQLWLP